MATKMAMDPKAFRKALCNGVWDIFRPPASYERERERRRAQRDRERWKIAESQQCISKNDTTQDVQEQPGSESDDGDSTDDNDPADIPHGRESAHSPPDDVPYNTSSPMKNNESANVPRKSNSLGARSTNSPAPTEQKAGIRFAGSGGSRLNRQPAALEHITHGSGSGLNSRQSNTSQQYLPQRQQIVWQGARIVGNQTPQQAYCPHLRGDATSQRSSANRLSSPQIQTQIPPDPGAKQSPQGSAQTTTNHTHSVRPESSISQRFSNTPRPVPPQPSTTIGQSWEHTRNASDQPSDIYGPSVADVAPEQEVVKWVHSQSQLFGNGDINLQARPLNQEKHSPPQQQEPRPQSHPTVEPFLRRRREAGLAQRPRAPDQVQPPATPQPPASIVPQAQAPPRSNPSARGFCAPQEQHPSLSPSRQSVPLPPPPPQPIAVLPPPLPAVQTPQSASRVQTLPTNTNSLNDVYHIPGAVPTTSPDHRIPDQHQFQQAQPPNPAPPPPVTPPPIQQNYTRAENTNLYNQDQNILSRHLSHPRHPPTYPPDSNPPRQYPHHEMYFGQPLYVSSIEAGHQPFRTQMNVLAWQQRNLHSQMQMGGEYLLG
jgi:hypothetical protein